jgi:tRNA(Ile)-lysidine synthase
MKNKTLTLIFWNKINNFINKNIDLKKTKNILIALSGGPDSMAMLHFFLKSKYADKIIAAHLNHSIRKEADSEEEFIKLYCKKNKIKLITEKKDIPLLSKKNKKSLEDIARKERYDFLYKTAKKNNCEVICTAHHLDDNIETFFLNLIRGIKLNGLKGIPIVRKHKDIIIFRPMLSVSKREILSYLKENKIKFRKDKSNEDVAYTRNWIRKKLIPLLERKQPQIKKHLLEMIEQINKLL